mgnify:CR=1 FL=1
MNVCLRFFGRSFGLVPIILEFLNTLESDVEVQALQVLSSIQDALDSLVYLVWWRTKASPGLCSSLLLLFIKLLPECLRLGHV